MQTEWVSTGERVKINAAFMSAGRKWSGYADLWSESVFCARFESSKDDDGRVSIGEEINHCRAVTFVSLKKIHTAKECRMITTKMIATVPHVTSRRE